MQERSGRARHDDLNGLLDLTHRSLPGVRRGLGPPGCSELASQPIVVSRPPEMALVVLGAIAALVALGGILYVLLW